MKILLDNNNASIASVVNICCERINADLANYSADESEYDLIIKDCDENSDISEFDKEKTLFLIPKSVVANFSSCKYLQKPFLPTDLINCLTSLGSNSQESKTEIADQPISAQVEEKIAKDIKTISKIVKEIDNMPEKTDEKIQTGGVSMPSGNENVENMIDEFYMADDDRPLEELLKEINDLKARGLLPSEPAKEKTAQTAQNLQNNAITIDDNFDLDDDIPLDELIKKMQSENAENSSNSAPAENKIEIDDNFDLDDDIPLDELIKNMQNKNSENSENSEKAKSIEKAENLTPAENKIEIDDNFDLDDDIPLDELIKNMQNKNAEKTKNAENTENSAPAENENEQTQNSQTSPNDEFNQILDSINEDDITDNTPIALADDSVELNQNEQDKNDVSKNEDEAKDDVAPVALAKTDDNEKSDDDGVVPIALAQTDDEKSGDDGVVPIALADDETQSSEKDDENSPIALVDSVEKDEQKEKIQTELANLDDGDLPILNLANSDENLDDDLLPLDLANDDDLQPLELSIYESEINDEKSFELANLDDEDLPILSLSGDENDDLPLLDLGDEKTENFESDEENENVEASKNVENTEVAQEEAKKDFSDLKLVEVGKFADSDLEKKAEVIETKEPEAEEKPQEIQAQNEPMQNDKVAQNEPINEPTQQNEPLQQNDEIAQIPQEIESKDVEIIPANADEEMNITELREKLENTFKEAFEKTVASDEKLAKALKNLKLDLNISFKDR